MRNAQAISKPPAPFTPLLTNRASFLPPRAAACPIRSETSNCFRSFPTLTLVNNGFHTLLDMIAYTDLQPDTAHSVVQAQHHRKPGTCWAVRYRSSRSSLGCSHSFLLSPYTHSLQASSTRKRLEKPSEPRALRYRASLGTRKFLIRAPAIPIAAFHPLCVGRP